VQAGKLDAAGLDRLALRYVEGSAPAPVATTAQTGKSTSRGELRTG